MDNVIVTGAGRGLGLEISRKLAQSNYRVIGISRTPTDEFAAAARQVAGPSGGAMAFIPFDLAQVAGLQALVMRIREEFGPIYGLVNNAGTSFEGLLGTMHNSQIEQLIQLNTLSPILLTKYAVRGMMSEGRGRIVNISSIVASTGYRALSVYSATKASMIGFTKSLAREVGSLGVTVNAVAPGFLDTRMTQGLKGEQRRQVVRRSALHRLADVDDVANAVDYLISEKGRNITGTVLTVDAGSTA